MIGLAKAIGQITLGLVVVVLLTILFCWLMMFIVGILEVIGILVLVVGILMIGYTVGGWFMGKRD